MTAERTEKQPRVIEPIDDIEFIPGTRQWYTEDLSLYDQLRERDGILFQGEGVLMRANTDQLRTAFSEIITEQGSRTVNTWTNEGQQLVMDVAEYIAFVHEGHMRKDGFTPYEHHLLRVAARVAQLDISNPYMVAVALLHDAPEDRDVTLELMQDYFIHEKGYDNKTVTKLFEGANALNNQRDEKELSSQEYFKNINATTSKYPDLHLWVIKGLDRYDSFVSDLSATIRHKEIDAQNAYRKFDDTKIRRTDADKIKKTAEKKILPIRRRIKKNEEGSGIITKIDEAVNLSDKLINDHGYKIKRGIIGGTVYNAGKVFGRRRR